MPARLVSECTFRRALLLASGAPSVVRAQLAGGGAVPEVDTLRLGIALFVCLALGVAVILLMRRQGPLRRLPGGPASVRIVETVRLGPRGTLHVVEFEGQKILLAADANGAVSVVTGTVGREAARTRTEAPA